MPTKLRNTLVATTLLLLGSSAHSAIYRCVNASGQIDFRDSPCTAQQQGSALPPLVINRLPAPASDEEQPARRQTAAQRKQGRSSQMAQEMAGEGGIQIIESGQRMDACGDTLDSRSRRRAIIEQRIYPGMSQAAVERALGQPEQRSRSGSKVRYHYPARAGHKAQTITFDEFGCVTGKSRQRRQ